MRFAYFFIFLHREKNEKETYIINGENWIIQ